MPLPKRLVRVEWWAAVGWPEPERRQRTARNFASAQAAGRQLRVIDELPSHLELIACYETTCTWTPVDPDSVRALYNPDTDDADDIE